jgi:hypothetical protein
MGYLAAIGRARPVTDVTNYYLGLKRDERESQLIAMQQQSHAKKMALADIASAPASVAVGVSGSGGMGAGAAGG